MQAIAAEPHKRRPRDEMIADVQKNNRATLDRDRADLEFIALGYLLDRSYGRRGRAMADDDTQAAFWREFNLPRALSLREPGQRKGARTNPYSMSIEEAEAYIERHAHARAPLPRSVRELKKAVDAVRSFAPSAKASLGASWQAKHDAEEAA